MSGTVGKVDGEAALVAEANRALDLVGSDPRRALAAADAVLPEASRGRSPEAVATAQRAAGLALRNMGELTAAETRLRAGVRSAANRAPRAAAEARMSLAFVLLERGRVRAALNQADRAASSLKGVAAARLRGQRALVLQRSGRTNDALSAYADAIPVLQKRGDKLWEAGLRNNRALLNAYGGSFAAAERDLHRARHLWNDLGQELPAADVECNLGFLAALKGDVPEALARYDEAEGLYKAQGRPTSRLLLDRCAVLLSVGLYTETAEVAARAIEDLEAKGAETDLGEGLLVLAQALLGCGDANGAAAQAKRARQLFERQARPGWALLARYVALRAQADKDPTMRMMREAKDVADALGRARWSEEELDALIVAGTTALALGKTALARTFLDRTKRARRRGSLSLRAHAWHAEALFRLAQGNHRGATRAIDSGLRALHRDRQLLGATEFRTHVAVHGIDLATLGLRMAIESHDPAKLFDRAERWRAGALHLRPVRPPHDRQLAALLAELRRAASNDAERKLGRLGDAPHDEQSRLAIEEQVRALSRRASGVAEAAALAPPSPSEMTTLLGGRAFVELLIVDGTIHALSLVDGRLRHHIGGSLSAIELEAESLHFALNRLVSGHKSHRTYTALQGAAGRLDSALFGPLSEIADRELVISPSGVLHAIPWAALPSCADRPITVVPSAAAWLRAERIPHQRQGSVALVAGPGLPEADAEVVALAGLHPKATVLRGSEATAERVSEAMDGASVAHLATHGQLRTDNPMFSALELADGPLTVYDLERLNSVPPLVVLPACRSGVGMVRAGDETQGLTAALLALGARVVIAALVPIPDDRTRDLMLALHRRLAEGKSPSVALRDAATDTAQDEVAAATAMGFVCLGAG